LPLDPGRATFGGFTTDGNLAFDADHVGVLARFRRGDLYDRRKVDDPREDGVDAAVPHRRPSRC
jgi:translocation and assembly module TamA